MRLACFTTLFILGTITSAAAQLQPGDIVIIGLQSDGTDRFAWAPLVDLEAGQVIYFTDAGWHAEQGMFQRQINEAANPATTSPSGGAMRYTTPASGLAAGTVVEVRVDSRTTGEPGAYVLTVTGADAADFSAANDEDIFGSQGVSISTSGDQLIIFTGSPDTPFFLFGVNSGAGVWDRGSTSAQHASDVPAGLIDSVTAVAIGAGPDSGDEVDNGRYAGPSEGTVEDLLAAVTDRSNWETGDTPIDDITNGITLFSILDDSIPPPVLDTTATIVLDTVFMEPGAEVKLEISVINTSDIGIGEIRFRLHPGGVSHVTIDELAINDALAGFEAETIWSAEGDTLDVFVFSATGATIPPGRHILGELCLTADDGPVPDILGYESPIGLIDTSLVVINSFGQPVGSTAVDGAVRIGIRGDVSRDGRTNIMDVIRCVKLILGIDGNTIPDPGSVSFAIADGNADGQINIGDAIAIVNRILGIHAVTPKTVSNAPAIIRLGVPAPLKDGRLGIPVFIASQRPIAGAQMTFAYQTAHMTVDTPDLDAASGFIMESAALNDEFRVILYSLNPEPYLPSEHTPLLVIPVSLSQHVDEADFALTEIILADRFAQRMPHRTETDLRTLRSGPRSDTVSDTFALQGNAPNPFNPSTTIAYTVPEQAHVTLTVYNMLGQEVIRLVDQRQTSGHYRVVWNGRNTAGEEAASGMYMYRLTSDTGYAETRRMTLVK